MQTKPLRNYGIDVTQTSFKPIMEELGLEKSVNELTQAEKEILRYISTLRQAQNAMGDFANTIESPANQLKILRQQFYEMRAAIGSLFVGLFADILPYVNAIIMVIKEVARTIASFLGIRIQDYNSGVASYADTLEEYSDALDGVGGSAGSASDAIKELKRQTLGFDQINNLTSPTPKSSSGGGGGGAGGSILDGIDKRLLDAIKGYDNGMERVRMKANQIKDKIMKILGFHEELNYETGEWEWKYGGIGTSLKNIWDWFKKLDFPQKALAVTGVATAFSLIYTWGTRIAKLTGLDKVFNGIKNILSPTKNLLTEIKNGIATTKSFTHGFQEGVEKWRVSQGIIDETTGKIKGFSGVVQGVKSAVVGLGEMAAGLTILDKSITDLKMNGASLVNMLGLVGGTFSTVLGGIQVGAVFGPMGAAIGGVVGALASLCEVLTPVNVELRKNIEAVNAATKENENYFNSIKETREAKDEEIAKSVSVSNYHKKLLTELKNITDENGKVKKGYEDRAQFIVTTLSNALDIEIGYQDGIIQNYDEIIKSAGNAIEAEKRYAKYKGLKEKYEENQKNIDTTIEKLKDQSDEYWKAKDSLQGAANAYRDWVNYGDEHPLGALIDAGGIKTELDDATKSYNGAKDTLIAGYKEYWQAMIDNNKYEREMVANTQGNYDEVSNIQKESKKETIKNLRQTMVEQTKITDISSPEAEELLMNWRVLSIMSKDGYMESISELPKDTAAQINVLTGNVTEVTPEVVEAFKALGDQSEDKMMEAINKLPDDIRLQVMDKLFEESKKIPGKVQEGIDSQPPAKAKIETSSKQEVQKKVNDATSGVSGSVNVGVNMPSRWSLQNTLSSLLSGVSGGLNLIFRKNADGGVFANGRWQPIQGYANGGLPSGGQLFMAREAGPELVGKIGRNTAVMNNNQIVDSVKAGVYEAVSAAMGGGIGSVEVYVHTDEGVVVDRINKITRQTGNCPINI